MLVPNARGLERAVAAGVDAICLVTAATDSYVRHNIGMSIDESLAAFAPIAAEARESRLVDPRATSAPRSAARTTGR